MHFISHQCEKHLVKMSVPQFFADTEMTEFRGSPTLDDSGYDRLFIHVAEERDPFGRTQTWQDLPAYPFGNLGIHRLILKDQTSKCTEMIRPVFNVPLFHANDTKTLLYRWKCHKLSTWLNFHGLPQIF